MTEQQEQPITFMESKEYRSLYANGFNVVYSPNETFIKIIRIEPKMDIHNNKQIGIIQNIECQLVVTRTALLKLHEVVGDILAQTES